GNWKEVVRGIPADELVNTVREDPERPGLLFCGTEQAVYVSLNDGDDWSPLRLNMPAASIRDLVIHGDDLVVGTHGRSFWILDNITPLRQLEPWMTTSLVNLSSQQARPGMTASPPNQAAPQVRPQRIIAPVLFSPQVAYRVRRSRNTDTPLPPEEPMGQ